MRPVSLFARNALRATSASSSSSAWLAASSSSSARRAALSSTRWFSIKAEAASDFTQKALDASRLSVTETQSPKPLSEPETLVFGKEFTGASREKKAKRGVC